MTTGIMSVETGGQSSVCTCDRNGVIADLIVRATIPKIDQNRKHNPMIFKFHGFSGRYRSQLALAQTI